MIAVIADDFTGAAEIGGVGLRHGLKVVIETEPVRNNVPDLLVVATDTRSLQPEEAAKEMALITQKLLKLNPSFVYKKVDSALRGNVKEELLAQMNTSGKRRAIIIAANPVFKRTIRNGIYYIDDKPLNETCFSNDPQYPVTSSAVLEIVGTNTDTLIINLKPGEKLPEKGIVIGDVSGSDDLNTWAQQDDEQTLMAGASGFFDAVLNKLHIPAGKKALSPPPFGEKALFVLGSTFPKEMNFLNKLKKNGHYLSNMPEEIYYNKGFDPAHIEEWIKDIVHGIQKHKKVIASVAHSPGNEPGIAFRIRKNIGELVKKVVEATELNELLIEGGSTTSMVLHYLNVKKLIPIQELDFGVIRMEMEGYPDLYVTTKPGSYYWPNDVWKAQNIKKMKNISYD